MGCRNSKDDRLTQQYKAELEQKRPDDLNAIRVINFNLPGTLPLSIKSKKGIVPYEKYHGKTNKYHTNN